MLEDCLEDAGRCLDVQLLNAFNRKLSNIFNDLNDWKVRVLQLV